MTNTIPHYIKSNAKIYPISYLESLSLNKNYICVIANPNLIIENKIFTRISKIKEIKKFTNAFKIIKAYSNLIGISKWTNYSLIELFISH